MGALGGVFASFFGTPGLYAAGAFLLAGIAFLCWFRMKFGYWPDQPPPQTHYSRANAEEGKLEFLDYTSRVPHRSMISDAEILEIAREVVVQFDDGAIAYAEGKRKQLHDVEDDLGVAIWERVLTVLRGLKEHGVP